MQISSSRRSRPIERGKKQSPMISPGADAMRTLLQLRKTGFDNYLFQEIEDSLDIKLGPLQQGDTHFLSFRNGFFYDFGGNITAF